MIAVLNLIKGFNQKILMKVLEIVARTLPTLPDTLLEIKEFLDYQYVIA